MATVDFIDSEVASVLTQLDAVAEDRIRDARAARVLLTQIAKAARTARRDDRPLPTHRILRRLCYFANARDTVIRSATYRAVRHVLWDSHGVALLCRERLILSLARSLEREPRYLWERVQALKVVKLIMDVAPTLLPFALLRSLVAIASFTTSEPPSSGGAAAKGAQPDRAAALPAEGAEGGGVGLGGAAGGAGRAGGGPMEQQLGGGGGGAPNHASLADNVVAAGTTDNLRRLALETLRYAALNSVVLPQLSRCGGISTLLEASLELVTSPQDWDIAHMLLLTLVRLAADPGTRQHVPPGMLLRTIAGVFTSHVNSGAPIPTDAASMSAARLRWAAARHLFVTIARNWGVLFGLASDNSGILPSLLSVVLPPNPPHACLAVLALLLELMCPPAAAVVEQMPVVLAGLAPVLSRHDAGCLAGGGGCSDACFAAGGSPLDLVSQQALGLALASQEAAMADAVEVAAAAAAHGDGRSSSSSGNTGRPGHARQAYGAPSAEAAPGAEVAGRPLALSADFDQMAHEDHAVADGGGDPLRGAGVSATPRPASSAHASRTGAAPAAGDAAAEAPWLLPSQAGFAVPFRGMEARMLDPLAEEPEYGAAFWRAVATVAGDRLSVTVQAFSAAAHADSARRGGGGAPTSPGPGAFSEPAVSGRVASALSGARALAAQRTAGMDAARSRAGAGTQGGGGAVPPRNGEGATYVASAGGSRLPLSSLPRAAAGVSASDSDAAWAAAVGLSCPAPVPLLSPLVLLQNYRAQLLVVLMEAGLIRALVGGSMHPHPVVCLAASALLKYVVGLGLRILPRPLSDELWQLPDLVQLAMHSGARTVFPTPAPAWSAASRLVAPSSEAIAALVAQSYAFRARTAGDRIVVERPVAWWARTAASGGSGGGVFSPVASPATALVRQEYIAAVLAVKLASLTRGRAARSFSASQAVAAATAAALGGGSRAKAAGPAKQDAHRRRDSPPGASNSRAGPQSAMGIVPLGAAAPVATAPVTAPSAAPPPPLQPLYFTASEARRYIAEFGAPLPPRSGSSGGIFSGQPGGPLGIGATGPAGRGSFHRAGSMWGDGLDRAPSALILSAEQERRGSSAAGGALTGRSASGLQGTMSSASLARQPSRASGDVGEAAGWSSSGRAQAAGGGTGSAPAVGGRIVFRGGGVPRSIADAAAASAGLGAPPAWALPERPRRRGLSAPDAGGALTSLDVSAWAALDIFTVDGYLGAAEGREAGGGTWGKQQGKLSWWGGDVQRGRSGAGMRLQSGSSEAPPSGAAGWWHRESSTVLHQNSFIAATPAAASALAQQALHAAQQQHTSALGALGAPPMGRAAAAATLPTPSGAPNPALSAAFADGSIFAAGPSSADMLSRSSFARWTAVQHEGPRDDAQRDAAGAAAQLRARHPQFATRLPPLTPAALVNAYAPGGIGTGVAVRHQFLGHDGGRVPPASAGFCAVGGHLVLPLQHARGWSSYTAAAVDEGAPFAGRLRQPCGREALYASASAALASSGNARPAAAAPSGPSTAALFRTSLGVAGQALSVVAFFDRKSVPVAASRASRLLRELTSPVLDAGLRAPSFAAMQDRGALEATLLSLVATQAARLQQLGEGGGAAATEQSAPQSSAAVRPRRGGSVVAGVYGAADGAQPLAPSVAAAPFNAVSVVSQRGIALAVSMLEGIQAVTPPLADTHPARRDALMALFSTAAGAVAVGLMQQHPSVAYYLLGVSSGSAARPHYDSSAAASFSPPEQQQQQQQQQSLSRQTTAPPRDGAVTASRSDQFGVAAASSYAVARSGSTGSASLQAAAEHAVMSTTHAPGGFSSSGSTETQPGAAGAALPAEDDAPAPGADAPVGDSSLAVSTVGPAGDSHRDSKSGASPQKGAAAKLGDEAASPSPVAATAAAAPPTAVLTQPPFVQPLPVCDTGEDAARPAGTAAADAGPAEAPVPSVSPRPGPATAAGAKVTSWTNRKVLTAAPSSAAGSSLAGGAPGSPAAPAQPSAPGASTDASTASPPKNHQLAQQPVQPGPHLLRPAAASTAVAGAAASVAAPASAAAGPASTASAAQPAAAAAALIAGTPSDPSAGHGPAPPSSAATVLRKTSGKIALPGSSGGAGLTGAGSGAAPGGAPLSDFSSATSKDALPSSAAPGQGTAPSPQPAAAAPAAAAATGSGATVVTREPRAERTAFIPQGARHGRIMSEAPAPSAAAASLAAASSGAAPAPAAQPTAAGSSAPVATAPAAGSALGSTPAGLPAAVPSPATGSSSRSMLRDVAQDAARIARHHAKLKEWEAGKLSANSEFANNPDDVLRDLLVVTPGSGVAARLRDFITAVQRDATATATYSQASAPRTLRQASSSAAAKWQQLEAAREKPAAGDAAVAAPQPHAVGGQAAPSSAASAGAPPSMTGGAPSDPRGVSPLEPDAREGREGALTGTGHPPGLLPAGLGVAAASEPTPAAAATLQLPWSASSRQVLASGSRGGGIALPQAAAGPSSRWQRSSSTEVRQSVRSGPAEKSAQEGDPAAEKQGGASAAAEKPQSVQPGKGSSSTSVSQTPLLPSQPGVPPIADGASLPPPDSVGSAAAPLSADAPDAVDDNEGPPSLQLPQTRAPYKAGAASAASAAGAEVTAAPAMKHPLLLLRETSLVPVGGSGEAAAALPSTGKGEAARPAGTGAQATMASVAVAPAGSSSLSAPASALFGAAEAGSATPSPKHPAFPIAPHPSSPKQAGRLPPGVSFAPSPHSLARSNSVSSQMSLLARVARSLTPGRLRASGSISGDPRASADAGAFSPSAYAAPATPPLLRLRAESSASTDSGPSTAAMPALLQLGHVTHALDAELGDDLRRGMLLDERGRPIGDLLLLQWQRGQLGMAHHLPSGGRAAAASWGDELHPRQLTSLLLLARLSSAAEQVPTRLLLRMGEGGWAVVPPSLCTLPPVVSRLNPPPLAASRFVQQQPELPSRSGFAALDDWPWRRSGCGGQADAEGGPSALLFYDVAAHETSCALRGDSRPFFSQLLRAHALSAPALEPSRPSGAPATVAGAAGPAGPFASSAAIAASAFARAGLNQAVLSAFAAVRVSKVVGSKDWRAWDWGTVATLLDHHLTCAGVLSEVFAKTLFMSRLGEFFARLAGGEGILGGPMGAIPWVPASLRFVRAARQWLLLCLNHPGGVECVMRREAASGGAPAVGGGGLQAGGGGPGAAGNTDGATTDAVGGGGGGGGLGLAAEVAVALWCHLSRSFRRCVRGHGEPQGRAGGAGGAGHPPRRGSTVRETSFVFPGASGGAPGGAAAVLSAAAAPKPPTTPLRLAASLSRAFLGRSNSSSDLQLSAAALSYSSGGAGAGGSGGDAAGGSSSPEDAEAAACDAIRTMLGRSGDGEGTSSAFAHPQFNMTLGREILSFLGVLAGCHAGRAILRSLRARPLFDLPDAPDNAAVVRALFGRGGPSADSNGVAHPGSSLSPASSLAVGGAKAGAGSPRGMGATMHIRSRTGGSVAGAAEAVLPGGGHPATPRVLHDTASLPGPRHGPSAGQDELLLSLVHLGLGARGAEYLARQVLASLDFTEDGPARVLLRVWMTSYTPTAPDASSNRGRGRPEREGSVGGLGGTLRATSRLRTSGSVGSSEPLTAGSNAPAARKRAPSSLRQRDGGSGGVGGVGVAQGAQSPSLASSAATAATGGQPPTPARSPPPSAPPAPPVSSLPPASKAMAMYTTCFTRALLRRGCPGFSSWVVELLVIQLYHEDGEIACAALSVLTEAAARSRIFALAVISRAPPLRRLPLERVAPLVCLLVAEPTGLALCLAEGVLPPLVDAWLAVGHVHHAAVLQESLAQCFVTNTVRAGSGLGSGATAAAAAQSNGTVATPVALGRPGATSLLGLGMASAATPLGPSQLLRVAEASSTLLAPLSLAGVPRVPVSAIQAMLGVTACYSASGGGSSSSVRTRPTAEDPAVPATPHGPASVAFSRRARSAGHGSPAAGGGRAAAPPPRLQPPQCPASPWPLPLYIPGNGTHGVAGGAGCQGREHEEPLGIAWDASSGAYAAQLDALMRLPWRIEATVEWDKATTGSASTSSAPLVSAPIAASSGSAGSPGITSPIGAAIGVTADPFVGGGASSTARGAPPEPASRPLLRVELTLDSLVDLRGLAPELAACSLSQSLRTESGEPSSPVGPPLPCDAMIKGACIDSQGLPAPFALPSSSCVIRATLFCGALPVSCLGEILVCAPGGTELVVGPLGPNGIPLQRSSSTVFAGHAAAAAGASEDAASATFFDSAAGIALSVAAAAGARAPTSAAAGAGSRMPLPLVQPSLPQPLLQQQRSMSRGRSAAHLPVPGSAAVTNRVSESGGARGRRLRSYSASATGGIGSIGDALEAAGQGGEEGTNVWESPGLGIPRDGHDDILDSALRLRRRNAVAVGSFSVATNRRSAHAWAADAGVVVTDSPVAAGGLSHRPRAASLTDVMSIHGHPAGVAAAPTTSRLVDLAGGPEAVTTIFSSTILASQTGGQLLSNLRTSVERYSTWARCDVATAPLWLSHPYVAIAAGTDTGTTDEEGDVRSHATHATKRATAMRVAERNHSPLLSENSAVGLSASAAAQAAGRTASGAWSHPAPSKGRVTCASDQRHWTGQVESGHASDQQSVGGGSGGPLDPLVRVPSTASIGPKVVRDDNPRGFKRLVYHTSPGSPLRCTFSVGEQGAPLRLESLEFGVALLPRVAALHPAWPDLFSQLTRSAPGARYLREQGLLPPLMQVAFPSEEHDELHSSNSEARSSDADALQLLELQRASRRLQRRAALLCLAAIGSSPFGYDELIRADPQFALNLDAAARGFLLRSALEPRGRGEVSTSIEAIMDGDDDVEARSTAMVALGFVASHHQGNRDLYALGWFVPHNLALGTIGLGCGLVVVPQLPVTGHTLLDQRITSVDSALDDCEAASAFLFRDRLPARKPEWEPLLSRVCELSSRISQREARTALLRAKVDRPDLFASAGLYMHVHALLSRYTMVLPVRRFVHALFDRVSFSDAAWEAQA